MTDCICHRSQTPSLLCACVFLHVHLKERERKLGKQLSQAGDASVGSGSCAGVEFHASEEERQAVPQLQHIQHNEAV